MRNEMNALVVDEVDLDTIDWLANKPGDMARALPVQRVALPLDKVEDAAVFSWRWDVQAADGFSVNAWLGIQRARQLGVRHLFMDMVSVNQDLDSDALIDEVVAFSRLYRLLPVIAAYDDRTVDGPSWYWTMRRPWILRELREMRANPHALHYVGYLQGQGSETWPVGLGDTPTDGYRFTDMLSRVWRSSFTHSILGVLCGRVGMYSPTHLRYLMPEHGEILAQAVAQLEHNDFLLVAAILCNMTEFDPGDPRSGKVNADADISQATYSRLQLVEAEGGTYDSNRAILLDGERIATWRSHFNLYTSNTHSYLQPAADAERIIFSLLGLSDSDYLRYVERAEPRRRSLLLPDAADDVKPAIDVVRLMPPPQRARAAVLDRPKST